MAPTPTIITPIIIPQIIMIRMSWKAMTPRKRKGFGRDRVKRNPNLILILTTSCHKGEGVGDEEVPYYPLPAVLFPAEDHLDH
jgi:hypothetical protein